MTVLRFVLGLVIAANSLALVVSQIHGHKHHALGLFLALLGLAELIAAILILIPATVKPGGIALIAVFAVAALFHVLHGEYAVSYLAIYAAAAFAVVSNWKRA